MKVEIRVISDSKAANKTVINELDTLILKSSIPSEVNVEFRNIRTRIRQPKSTPSPKVESNSNGEEEDSQGD